MTRGETVRSSGGGNELMPRAPDAAWGQVARWIGPALCAIAFTGMAILSWRKCPDPLVDFGRELYVPWQLSQGKVLYRDIAVLFGPFSQYLNAFFFRLFGVSLTTLIFCNLAILAGLTCLIYRLLRAACDRLTATAACLVFLLVFGFGQYLACGNYNYVCPYAHEATHGVALNVGMIYCLTRAARRPYLMGGLAGLCFGLALLTKAEPAFAAVLVLLTYGAVAVLARPAIAWPGWRPVCVMGVAAVTPIAGFFAYFSTRMPASQALRAAATAWNVPAMAAASGNLFYRQRMGLDDVHGNVLMMLKSFAGLLFVVMVAAAIDLALQRWRRARAILAAIMTASLFAVLLCKPDLLRLEAITRPLPIVAVAVLGLLVVRAAKTRVDTVAVDKALPLVLWATFALAMLAKMALKVELVHYGFVLAMPAALLLVIVLLWLIPALLAATPDRAMVFRGVALAAMAACVFDQVKTSRAVYGAKDFVVGGGGDTILAFQPSSFFSGIAAAAGLAAIEKFVPADATLAVLPEGVMLNYLSRRVNPTRFISLMPLEVAAFGEEEILASFKENPPAFVCLIHRTTDEYGVGLFGRDARYGKKIIDWIDAAYESVAVIGAEPFEEAAKFGIKLMRRRASQD